MEALLWKPLVSCPLLAAQFLAISPQNNMISTSYYGAFSMKSSRNKLLLVAALSPSNDNNDDFGKDIDTITSTSSCGILNGKAAKGSGTTARGRRLLKIREEKRKREYDRLHNYPTWAKVLEDACKNDAELRAVLGDSIGNPELMRKRVIQSWYVMGRLGAFNSSNLQLANSSMEYDPLYDADKGFKVMPSSFHDISNVEFQDNWGRVWVDLGTSDFFAIDVLLNCLTVLSSEYVGIQQVVFGGRRMGDWEEGMTSPDFGYKYFNI
ncbi:uncharacterized protein LOC132275428 isoform X2 [Cornus florida]|uniref:uncharacterized protein LOC132275428 isoform X2 n=1 Tax=Cornus florida TaxID=4283 RepID=UPI00289A03BC|nr:uncharacterized protein LOC132275428 isoform X2 [Cornus florida]